MVGTAEKLASLRATLATAGLETLVTNARVSLGHRAADAVLKGGLERGALHEVYAATNSETAATAFRRRDGFGVIRLQHQLDVEQVARIVQRLQRAHQSGQHRRLAVHRHENGVARQARPRQRLSGRGCGGADPGQKSATGRQLRFDRFVGKGVELHRRAGA